ncbi:MAG TPA: outer membrane beta-barrel protein [Afipia sp.]
MRKLLIAAAASLAFAGTASAADLGARPYTKAPVAPVFTWAGLYAGVQAGYVWGDTSTSNAVTCGAPGSAFVYVCNSTNVANATAIVNSLGGTDNKGGFTGGGHVGFNWQNSALVYGVEADLSAFDFRSSQRGTGLFPFGGGGGAALGGNTFLVTTSASSDWLATLRARLGWAVAPTALIYVTGGAAFSDVKVSNTYRDNHSTVDFDGAGASSTSSLRAGWTVGGGLEWAFAPNWTVRGEYLYVDLGKVDTVTLITNPLGHPGESTPFTTTATLRASIARAGVSYKF